jgi:hypothetical protein
MSPVTTLISDHHLGAGSYWLSGPDGSAPRLADLALKLEPLYAKEAAERQLEGQKMGGKTAGSGRPKQHCGKSSRKAKRAPESRERAAAAAKSNPKYVAALKKLDREAARPRRRIRI